jgi:putative spermidine/putrescine transport system ATP-binding protein
MPETTTARSAQETPRPPHGVEVRWDGVRRSYGTVTALDDLSLTLHPGELVALLGPSGCGKTTALRVLAGLEDADAGQVIIDGNDVTHLPPAERDIGMVFQAYSLFPHLTALQNVAFGLRLRGVRPEQRDRRAREMLDLVGLSAQADRYAHQLSGGQQQRVALARALAIRPRVLLLDEPLSALDAKVRSQLREQIRRIQLEVGITTVFVTHDQEEALAIADRVGVMRDGRLEQLGTPIEVYSSPATAFVAEFVGLTNRIPTTVRGRTAETLGARLPLIDPDVADGPALALIRPESIGLVGPGVVNDHAGGPETNGVTGHRTGTGTGTGTGTVQSSTFLGAISRVTVNLDTVGSVIVQMPTSDAAAHQVGSRVRVVLRPDPVIVIDMSPIGAPRRPRRR